MNRLPATSLNIGQRAKQECYETLLDIGLEGVIDNVWDDIRKRDPALFAILSALHRSFQSKAEPDSASALGARIFQSGACVSYFALTCERPDIPTLHFFAGRRALGQLETDNRLELFEQSLQADEHLSEIVDTVAERYTAASPASKTLMKLGAGTVRFFLGWQQRITNSSRLN